MPELRVGFTEVASLRWMANETIHLLLEISSFGRYLTQKTEDLIGDTIPGNLGTLVLCVLEVEGDHRVRDLAEATGVTSGRVTQVIGELSDRALVSVGKDPDDLRGTVVRLTAEGSAFVGSVGSALAQALRDDPGHSHRFSRALDAATIPKNVD